MHLPIFESSKIGCGSAILTLKSKLLAWHCTHLYLSLQKLKKTMNDIKNICVYSASSTKIDPVYFEAAEELGKILAQKHINLINGAGTCKL